MRVDDLFDDGAGFEESPDSALYYGDELDLLGEEVVEELEMLGFDTSDPDFMGGPFRRLFQKIRDRVRARRKRRADKKARSALGPEPAEVPYSVSTPRGTLTASSAGLSLTKPAGGVQTQPTGGLNPIAMIQQNPMLLLVPVAGIAIMMMGKKQRGGNGGRNGTRRKSRR